ncbi:MAG: S24 family peptidase [Acidobacteria bacterium]|nr:S24 family peptidase [Acidobacteriota bacterium]
MAPAAGDGAAGDSERVTGRIKFPGSWLRRHGLVADDCRVLTVAGESMEPTLPEGCSILIARHPRPRRAGRIFVVRTADGVVVKRAGKNAAGRWRLESDHPAWQPVPWPRDAEVVGEVRWAARTFA